MKTTITLEELQKFTRDAVTNVMLRVLAFYEPFTEEEWFYLTNLALTDVSALPTYEAFHRSTFQGVEQQVEQSKNVKDS